MAAVNKVGTSPFSDQSLTAVADTPPGRVRSISMLDRGDHTITVGWTKPASTTDIEEYLLTWLGNSVPLDGSTTSFVVPNLDNNRKYFFSIEARNSVGWSAVRQSEPFQSIGTPLPPSGLNVTDLQSGADVTDVRVNWTPTLPEGEAPTVYTVSYAVPGKAAVAVPGCSRIQGTSCTHGGRAYDGTIYSYSVRAHNAENTSPASTPEMFKAVGKPNGWGAWQAAPTGADNRLMVTATAPDSRGSTARAAILVAGQVVWEGDTTPGSAISQVVATPSNATAYPVQLRMCNETAPTGCTFSADAKSVQSYGPLRREHIVGIQAAPEGDYMRWNIQGTSNGRPAQVTIASGDRNQTFQVPAGEWSVQTEAVVIGWEEQEDVTVTLSDPAVPRGQAVAGAQASTPAPPQPEIVVVKGDACRDGDQTWTGPTCASRGWTDETCTELNCAFIQFSVSGFVNRYSCRINREGASPISFAVDPVQNIWRAQYHHGSNILPPLKNGVSIECQTPPNDDTYQGVESAYVAW